MGDLALASALEGEDGHFTAELSRDWEIWGPNGGYLATIALRAAGRVAAIARPASLHVHYLRVARFASVTLQVQRVHAGRQSESLQVTMLQDDKLILTALVRTAADTGGPQHDAAVAPLVADPEGLPSAEQLTSEQTTRFAFWENYERRVLQPESWQIPASPQPPHWLEWFRLRNQPSGEDPFLDASRAVLLIDTLCYPAAWRHHLPERAIAPSLDLTVWFHRPARTDWLLADARSPLAQAGLVAGSCQVWNRERQLVASGGGQMLWSERRGA